MPNGFLLIHKPSGPTSHDIIDELRRITGERKIGHAGTLDPFATGLLIVAVGREATRQISNFSKMDKTYVAKLHLGATSDTYDRTGSIQQLVRPHKLLSEEEIKKVLQKFVGEQTQIPPMYSAKKVHGKKLYELARKGIEIERKPADINIHYIKLLEFTTLPILSLTKERNSTQSPSLDEEGLGAVDNASHLIIETRVSSGTYIRTLAHDIGQALGCGAYLEELQRTEIDKYNLKNAVETKNLTKENWPEHLIDIQQPTC